MKTPLPTQLTLAIIGLGYVGLPLAVAFGRNHPTIGFDIDAARIRELQSGQDRTLEIEASELTTASHLTFSAEVEALQRANVFIVTVPTPIDGHKRPDLGPLIAASRTLATVLQPGSVVIYESTVYPGATEEICVPLLEQGSGLRLHRDLFVGYSPERINPGDKSNRLESICKVTSGSTPEVADFVDALYRRIITVGTHKASSIRVAEAAKVIENTQRDVNIALINELALIFHKLGIDTEEVLKAAGTKWNFLPFRPGLVGGHCIGVDPYYLTHKAMEVGYHPEMILAGRRLNDNMGSYVVERVTRLMTQRKIHVVDSRILVMGLTFKENCPDLRNTRVVDIVRELQELHSEVEVWDPWASSQQAQKEYGFPLIDSPEPGRYDAIILAVAHRQFVALGVEAIRRFGKPKHILFDVKYLLPAEQVDGRL